MRLGELVNSGLTQLSATESSQNPRNANIDTVPISACSRRCQNDLTFAGRGCADACVSFNGVAASMRPHATVNMPVFSASCSISRQMRCSSATNGG